MCPQFSHTGGGETTLGVLSLEAQVASVARHAFSQLQHLLDTNNEDTVFC